jgi:hypothetical protein
MAENMPKNLGYFCSFQETTLIKQLLNGGKFAQTLLPMHIPSGMGHIFAICAAQQKFRTH